MLGGESNFKSGNYRQKPRPYRFNSGKVVPEVARAQALWSMALVE
jgi:hypothetical protein